MVRGLNACLLYATIGFSLATSVHMMSYRGCTVYVYTIVNAGWIARVVYLTWVYNSIGIVIPAYSSVYKVANVMCDGINRRAYLSICLSVVCGFSVTVGARGGARDIN